MDREKVLKVFDGYLKGYNKSNKEVNSIIEHSMNVMKLSGEIARSLHNINEEEIFIAEVIGLFHDIGRFDQLRVYNTKNDEESIDHAGHAVSILIDTRFITKILNRRDYDDIIKNVIYYHNKFEIPDYLDQKSKVFISILRDADKVDGYRKSLADKVYDIRISAYPTKEVYEMFSKFKPVNKNMIVNDTDRILVDLGLIFDINYKYSFTLIKDNRIVDKIIEYLYIEDGKLKVFINDIRKVINSYINRRVGI